MITARFSDKYRAEVDASPAHAPNYTLLTIFTVPLDGNKPTVAIFANETLETYIWRRMVLSGKRHGQYMWRDCMTGYANIGDVIADIVKYYVDFCSRTTTHTQGD